MDELELAIFQEHFTKVHSRYPSDFGMDNRPLAAVSHAVCVPGKLLTLKFSLSLALNRHEMTDAENLSVYCISLATIPSLLPSLQVMGTAYTFTCPTRYAMQGLLAREQQRLTNPVWMYVFNHSFSFDGWGKYSFCNGYSCKVLLLLLLCGIETLYRRRSLEMKPPLLHAFHIV